MKNFYSKFLLFFGVLLTIAGGISFNPAPAQAIALCSTLSVPEIFVKMNSGTTSNGTSYSGDASVTYTPVPTTVNFTVTIDSEPGSVTNITYPGGSDNTPGLVSKSFTTSSINSSRLITVYVEQNCQEDVPPPPFEEVTITLNPQVPATTFSGSPLSGPAPLSTTLTWSATNNPTGCTASASPANSNWSGTKSVSGSQTITGLATGTHTFSLYCTNGGGNSSTKTATVTVSQSSFPVSATANPPAGGNPVPVSSPVQYNTPALFNVNANTSGGYYVNTTLSSVGGNCPKTGRGFLPGNTQYESGPVTESCNVIFNFNPNVPPTPTILSATPSSCGTGTINVDWTDSSGATNYTLKDGNAIVYTGGLSSLSHQGLANGSSHSYTVSATNTAGVSAFSSPAVSANAPAACVVNQPDLTASTPTPSTATKDVAQTFTATISNTGNASTGGSFSYFFQTAGQGGTGTIIDKASATTSSLNGGATRSVTFSNSWNTTGIKSIRICADKTSSTGGGVIDEGSNENNNCSSWSDVVVSSVTNGACSSPSLHYNCAAGTSASNVDGASAWTWNCVGSGSGATNASCSETKFKDLTISNTAPGTAVVGTPQTYTATITNGGTASTGISFPYFFQVSTGPNGTGSLYDLGSNTTTALGAGGTREVTYTETATVPGTYYMRACADKSNAASAGVVSESNENNNCSPSWTTVIVSPTPPMSGTLTPSATSCLIAVNNSSCNINFSWNTVNPVATSAITKPTNITVATGNSGTNVPLAVKYNSETFYLYNNGVLLDQETVTSSCASGTMWNNGACRAGVNGQCATPPNGYTYSSAPPGPLCTAGTAVPSSLSGTGPWSWVCNGSGVGTNASCSASYDAGSGEEECDNGAANYPECTIDDNNICLNGATNPPDCDLEIGTMGVCSTPDNHTNPCLVGAPSAITSGSSAWTWTCAASASTASCSEPKKKPIFIED